MKSLWHGALVCAAVSAVSCGKSNSNNSDSSNADFSDEAILSASTGQDAWPGEPVHSTADLLTGNAVVVLPPDSESQLDPNLIGTWQLTRWDGDRPTTTTVTINADQTWSESAVTNGLLVRSFEARLTGFHWLSCPAHLTQEVTSSYTHADESPIVLVGESRTCVYQVVEVGDAHGLYRACGREMGDKSHLSLPVWAVPLKKVENSESQ